MSEELIQRRLTKKGIVIGEYEFYPTHSTTIKQYKQLGIIPRNNYGVYEKRKPDGLFIDRRIIMQHTNFAQFITGYGFVNVCHDCFCQWFWLIIR